MKPTRRSRRWLIGAGFFILLFTVVGFFVVPPIARVQAEKRLSALLGRPVTIGQVRLNPYALSLTVENFDIREKDPAASFLGWTRLHVNFDALSSFGDSWVLSEVQLEGFHSAVAINPDKSFNFSDILAKLIPPADATPSSPPPGAEKSPRPIRVVRLAVTQARVDFSDRSVKQPFSTTLGPLTFALTEFRTAGDQGAPYRFEAVTEAGEKFAWSGTLAIDPMASRGEFTISDLVLKKYTPYLEDRVRADVLDGKLTVRGRYEASFTPGSRVLKLADGALQLRDLRIAERGAAQPAVELPSVEITNILADAVALDAAIGRVALTGGRLDVRRDQDGSINLLGMLPPAAPGTAPAPAPTTPPPAPSPTAAPAIAQPPLKLLVGEVAVTDFALNLTDHAAPRPARLALTGVQFSLKGFTLAESAPMPLDLAFGWAPQGNVHIAGTVALKPELKAELKTDVTALDLLPLSPYLEQFLNARLTGGTVTTSGTARLALPGGQPAVDFAGDVAVEKLGLVDGAHSEELAGVSRLTLTGLKAATSPQLSIALAEIAVTGPYARVLVNNDRSLNLASLAKTAPAPSAAPSVSVSIPSPRSAPDGAPRPAGAPPSPAAPQPRIEIARVTIAEGDFSFADRSVTPAVRTALTQFGGTISGLSSENLARADVALKGVVDGAGPIAISGKLDPLGPKPFVDLTLDFKNVDLVPLSPYSGKFAGYELARGKLVVDTKLKLDDKKVNASNVVTLNQFTFGAPTQSPDATKLPVRLGIALLKDLDGKIVIDIPVEGSLDDPSFRIGAVVLRVIGNLLTKAAVSPFSLIGSMFGGGGDELAFQEFAPGATDLQPAQIPKLETMVKALANRPGLSVALEGSYDAAADAYALKRQKLADTVRRRIWEERHAITPDIPPPAQLVIAPEEHAAMLKKMYDEKFPPGTEFGAPLPPPPAVTAPPPPPERGIIRRVTDFITLKERRERHAAEEEAARRNSEHAQAVAAATATGLPLEEMTGRLAEATPITDEDLRALATARAQKVRDYFTTTGQIAPDRLFLAQSQDAAQSAQGPRVTLSLQ